MNLTQIVLLLGGLGISAGGLFMLVRAAAADRRAEAAGRSVRPKPQLPLGVIAVGLIIAYDAYNNFTTFRNADVAILFLFALVLATLIGLRFFISGKLDTMTDRMPKEQDEGKG